MDLLSPVALIETMNQWPPEAIWVLLLVVCFSAILIAARTMGAAGLYAYIAVAIIGANLQVLKPVQFNVFVDPVALGTILFASSYLCTDILAEIYGRDAARKGVWIGFSAFLFWTVLGILTLGFQPLDAASAGSELAWAVPNHDAIATLFTPAPVFFVAGMTAYLISQFHDIWLYRLVGRLTGGRHLWLRNNVSTVISAVIDNTVFSLLAWIVLAPEPLALKTVIMTYILGTLVLRLIVALLDTPFLYAARAVLTPQVAAPAQA
ncbi:MAG: queuosine precursor transporter [Pseudomonadota bacterium]